MFTKTIAFTAIACGLLCACRSKPIAETLFTKMNGTGVNFTNTVHDTTDLNILNYRNFYNGGGAAIGDLNNDGLPDLFFTANQGANKLCLNKGNFQFKDISAKAGFNEKKQWSTGVVLADINADGWLDIYVSNAGSMTDPALRRNQLFINHHDLTFSDSAAAYGLDNDGYTTQVSFFDYDLDGDLDCFMINNSPVSPNKLNLTNTRDLPDSVLHLAPEMGGGGDHLFRNDGGHFTEVSRQAGIHGSVIAFGLGVTVGDVNGDGWPDVYVSNDYFERDYLYINQQNGTYKDEAEQWLQHTSLASMGADFGDINNDGYPEIFTTDMLPAEDVRKKTTLSFEDINTYRLKQKNGFYHQFFQNTLQLNNRNGKFLDIANYAGVAATDWSWGGMMFDADGDGYSDLYVCNGIYHDLINQDFLDFTAADIMQQMTATGKKMDMNVLVEKMPSIHVLNKMFRNSGNLQFEDIGEKWGFTEPSFSNGSAYGDLDGDGDLDLIVNNVNQPAFIYKNNSRQQTGNHIIGAELKGNGQNTFAIGSTVKVYRGNQVLTREIIPSRGFQSSMDYKVVIGLGENNTVDSMVILWPNRTSTTYLHPKADSVYKIDEKTAKKSSLSAQHTFSPSLGGVGEAAGEVLFSPIPSSFEKHEEDDYVDFLYERNVPQMLSCEGPKAATGDVNGDGLEDVYISSTVAKSGQLYLQTAAGRFAKKDVPVLRQLAGYEDAANLLFDCDKDGDLDLLLCPGGNNLQTLQSDTRLLQFRLLKNDSKGNFVLDATALPVNTSNISTAIANDWDGDGDWDLFIGGRSVVAAYGLTPQSYLLVNDGTGHFTDGTKALNNTIGSIGMVTGAVWANVQGNAQKELVIVGEWMTPRLFSYAGNHFTEVQNTGLQNLYGMWKTVAATDLNGDGKEDLLLGNEGENFCLRPTEQQPVKLWMGDFDNNGMNDKILTYTVEGKDKPVFLKREVEESMPFLKKQNLHHEAYAAKTVQELLPPEALSRAQMQQCNYAASCIAVNGGNGHFNVRKFPTVVQLSSVNAIHCTDLNGDGKTDVILGGNEFTFQPQLERLDASMGTILLNDSKGNLTPVDAANSGIELPGQLKDIVELKGKQGRQFLFLQNNRQPVLYKLTSPPAPLHKVERGASK